MQEVGGPTRPEQPGQTRYYPEARTAGGPPARPPGAPQILDPQSGMRATKLALPIVSGECDTSDPEQHYRSGQASDP